MAHTVQTKRLNRLCNNNKGRSRGWGGVETQTSFYKCFSIQYLQWICKQPCVCVFLLGWTSCWLALFLEAEAGMRLKGETMKRERGQRVRRDPWCCLGVKWWSHSGNPINNSSPLWYHHRRGNDDNKNDSSNSSDDAAFTHSCFNGENISVNEKNTAAAAQWLEGERRASVMQQAVTGLDQTSHWNYCHFIMRRGISLLLVQ